MNTELRKEFGQNFLFNCCKSLGAKLQQNNKQNNKQNDKQNDKQNVNQTITLNDLKNEQINKLTNFKYTCETDEMIMKSLIHILNKSNGKIFIECFEKGCLNNPNTDYSYSYISLLVHNSLMEPTTEIIENDQSITMYRINALWEQTQSKKENRYFAELKFKTLNDQSIVKKIKDDRKVRNIIVNIDKHNPKDAYYYDLMFHYPLDVISHLGNDCATELINNYFCCKIRHNKPGDHHNWIISTITQIN
jgi:hypothetical protein